MYVCACVSVFACVCSLSACIHVEPMRKPQSLGMQNSILRSAVAGCAHGQINIRSIGGLAARKLKSLNLSKEVATDAHIQGTTVSMTVRPHLSSRGRASEFLLCLALYAYISTMVVTF